MGDVRNASGPFRQSFSLHGPQGLDRLDDEDARRGSFPRGKNVGHELSVVRTLFDKCEVLRFPEMSAHLEELRGKKFSENGADTDAGEKISVLPGARYARCIIAVPRVVERRGHEFVESERASGRDARPQFGLKAG